MAKQKISNFVCNDCGADYTKWQGQCSECSAWNTLTEIRLSGPKKSSPQRYMGFAGAANGIINTLSDIDISEIPRIATGTAELDLVLGGGLVPGSCILVGGEPGAGKSTLLLQHLCKLATIYKSLYVTGEESPQQIAMRADRLGLQTDQLQLMAETSVELICTA
ncbi:MAG: DNA repair protein RadA, partial [Porticoccus sp.]|nr:DNA repair protein RadA [Porticoccus sp.]